MSTASTPIEWTDATWNPTRGCSRVSPGCENCYAERQAYRFSTKPTAPYRGLVRLGTKGPVWTGKVRLVPSALAEPLSWRKPRRVFVNSMSDLFHEGLSNEDIAAVFGVMAAAPQHTFQVLTKRAKRMREWFEWYEGTSGAGASSYAAVYQAVATLPEGDSDRLGTQLRRSIGGEGEPSWPLPNVWLGASVEHQAEADRIAWLLRTPAAVRFISYEPALGSLDVAPFLPPKLKTCGSGYPSCAHSLANSEACLDWVILGGESGPNARPFAVEWAYSVVRQCADVGVPCFVKQMGRFVRGSREGFAFDAYLFDDGSAWCPPIIGRRGVDEAEARAVGFVMAGKGGDMRDWPADLRVRQFPDARSAV